MKETSGDKKKKILAILLNFYTPNKPENQNFEKIKKTLGYITILHNS